MANNTAAPQMAKSCLNPDFIQRIDGVGWALEGVAGLLLTSDKETIWNPGDLGCTLEVMADGVRLRVDLLMESLEEADRKGANFTAASQREKYDLGITSYLGKALQSLYGISWSLDGLARLLFASDEQKIDKPWELGFLLKLLADGVQARVEIFRELQNAARREVDNA